MYIGRQSFQQAVEHLKDIRSKNCTVPVLLIGNKLDLEDERYNMQVENEFEKESANVIWLYAKIPPPPLINVDKSRAIFIYVTTIGIC